MKKLSLIILFLLIINSFTWAQLYFNLDVETGALITGDDTTFLSDLSTDLAYIISVTKHQALISYYKLQYSGPSLKEDDSRTSNSSQDHLVLLKYLIEVDKSFAIKPMVSYLKEFYKYAKNENWGEGLYDLNKYEFGTDILYKGMVSIPVNFTYKYQIYKYPNYTDLLTMYLTSYEETKEIENYHNHYFALTVDQSTLLKPIILDLEYNLNVSFYDNKKVLELTGYSGSEYQDGLNHLIHFSPQYKLSSVLFDLNFNLELNDSNQNYIFGFSPDSIQFFKNYYNYTAFQINPVITHFFSMKKYISLLFSYRNKAYSDRLAQDEAGNFLANDKVKINSIATGLRYNVKISKYFTLSPLYLYIQSESNNKYQQSVSYNYKAHQISFNLNYEY